MPRSSRAGRAVTPRGYIGGVGFMGALGGGGRLRPCSPPPASIPGPLSFCPYPPFSHWVSQAIQGLGTVGLKGVTLRPPVNANEESEV